MSNINNEMIYGQHMIIDAYGCDFEKLQNVEIIYDFLDQLPEIIEMQKIGPPQIAKFDDIDKAGVTGIVMIVTSHISIHTYSLKKCFFMDVFSCKSFNATKVNDFIIKTFDAAEIQFKSIERGLNFPVNNLV